MNDPRQGTIVVANDEIIIRTHIGHRKRCKAIPGVAWNRSIQAWTIPASSESARNVRAALQGAGVFGTSKDFSTLLETDDDASGLEPYPDILQTPLWDHQRSAIGRVLQHNGFMLYHGVGAGKTLSAIAAAAHRGNQKILIFAPKRVIGNEQRGWVKQINDHTGGYLTPVIARRKNSETLAVMVGRIRNELLSVEPPYAVLTNYETVNKAGEMRQWLLAAGWDLLIFDEVHRIKDPGGSTSQWIARLARKVPYRIGLTGTLMPNNPLDVYGPFRALDPSVFGTSFAAFRARFAITHPQFKNMVLDWPNKAEMNRLIYTITDHVKTNEVVDLPEKPPVETIPVTLSKKAFKHYMDLEELFYSWIQETGEEISLANVLVKLLRLQQLTGGYLHTDDGRAVRVDSSKKKALLDFLLDLPRDEKVVVFARFHQDLDQIREVCEDDRIKRRYGEISGRVGEEDYDAWIRDEKDLMGIQIQAGGEGLDELKTARIMIFWSPDFSLGRYEQAQGRLYRPGQNRNVLEYHLVAEGTVDEDVVEALKNKRRVVEEVAGREWGRKKQVTTGNPLIDGFLRNAEAYESGEVSAFEVADAIAMAALDIVDP